MISCHIRYYSWLNKYKEVDQERLGDKTYDVLPPPRTAPSHKSILIEEG